MTTPPITLISEVITTLQQAASERGNSDAKIAAIEGAITKAAQASAYRVLPLLNRAVATLKGTTTSYAGQPVLELASTSNDPNALLMEAVQILADRSTLPTEAPDDENWTNYGMGSTFASDFTPVDGEPRTFYWRSQFVYEDGRLSDFSPDYGNKMTITWRSTVEYSIEPQLLAEAEAGPYPAGVTGVRMYLGEGTPETYPEVFHLFFELNQSKLRTEPFEWGLLDLNDYPVYGPIPR